MAVTCEEEVEEEAKEEEGVEVVEEEGSVFWTFPPNIRLCLLVQLEPFWPFFMVAGGEEERDVFLIRRRRSQIQKESRERFLYEKLEMIQTHFVHKWIFVLFLLFVYFTFHTSLRKTQKRKPQTGTETNLRNNFYSSPPSVETFLQSCPTFQVLADAAPPLAAILEVTTLLGTADCVYKTRQKYLMKREA